MVNAQEWLESQEEYNTKEKRKEETYLNISEKKLKGHLNLKDFEKLEHLDCSDNQITGLNLFNSLQLKELWCNDNLIKSLDYSNLDPNKLTYLNISDNNLNSSHSQELTVFSNFVNLTHLEIGGTDDKKVVKRIRNCFHGSLKPLQNLKKLKFLDISNTDIDSGMEYLPVSLVYFVCDDESEKCCKVITEKLAPYGILSGYYDYTNTYNYQAWRKGNKELIEKVQREIAKEKGLSDKETDQLIRLSSLNEDKWEITMYLEKRERTQQWLHDNNVKELDISKKGLVGDLNLKGFVNLEKLNCSNNRLTSINLDGCSSLIKLICADNELCELDFLQSVNNLKYLDIKNNLQLSSPSLRKIEVLRELELLDISKCSSFEGSLKPLQNLSSLRELYVTDTDISEGLEYLPENCKKLYCNSDYPHKSTKIMEELDKSKCAEEKNGAKYYNLDKWRVDKADNATVSAIPLERLFVIRSNIKKFIDKWGVREKSSNNDEQKGKLKGYIVDSYDKFRSKFWKKDENDLSLSELSKLQDPKDSSKLRWANTAAQWTNRAVSVVGGSLVLIGQSDTENPNSQLYTQTGGVIAIASPFIEIITSQINDKIFEARQKEWDGFVEDTKNMLDSYHELKGILEKVEISKFGEVNEALKKLDEAVDSFLVDYDKDKNETINIYELLESEGRENLARDLNKKKDDKKGSDRLEGIVNAIEKLENEITKYRQGTISQTNFIEKSKDKRKKDEEAKSRETIAKSENNLNTVIHLEEDEQGRLTEQENLQEQSSTQAQIEQPPK